MEASSLGNLLESLDQLNDKCLIGLFITFLFCKNAFRNPQQKIVPELLLYTNSFLCLIKDNKSIVFAKNKKLPIFRLKK